MARKTVFRLAWILTLLAVASLACSLFTRTGENISKAKQTAESAATTVKQGQDLLATGKALVTEVIGSSAAQTLQAVATEQGPALLATIQTFATEQGPELAQTAQAFATQQGPSLLETGQALITQGPALLETAQAFATQAAVAPQQPPADIPILEGEKHNFFATQERVTYDTKVTYTDALDFYQSQMPSNGWTKTDLGSIVTESAATLRFDKPDRQAIVTLAVNPGDYPTIVLIIITPK